MTACCNDFVMFVLFMFVCFCMFNDLIFNYII